MVAALAWNTCLCNRPLHRSGCAPFRRFKVTFLRPPSHSPAVFTALRASLGEPPSSKKVDVSVFRFTLGIPGFNDSYLPRVLGIAFGAVLVLNHILTANPIPPAQWRSELVGLCNSLLAVSLPSIGQILNGRSLTDAAVSMPNSRQIFVLSKNLPHEEKEELAWGSYALLKNTRTTSLAIWNGDLLCVRGFWDVSSETGDFLQWLEEKLRKSSILAMENLAYVPFKADKVGWDFIPTGVMCSLVIPSAWRSTEAASVGKAFILLLSNTPNAFSQKDLQWIEWLAKKLLKSRSKSINEIGAKSVSSM